MCPCANVFHISVMKLVKMFESVLKIQPSFWLVLLQTTEVCLLIYLYSKVSYNTALFLNKVCAVWVYVFLGFLILSMSDKFKLVCGK